jgi:DNA-binding beta-propeller fold protein YncE
MTRSIRFLTATAAVFAAFALAPAAFAAPIPKLDGTDGCVADTGSTVPADTCATARGIDDATDVAISPDGKFAYAAATSSNSVAVFSRDSETGALTQLPGQAGCLVWDGDPTPPADCAPVAGLEGPSALAISPDGKNVYVTGFQLDPDASPLPRISGTLVTFSRNADSGALSPAGCAAGGAPPLSLLTTPPNGCTASRFPGLGSTRDVPLGTAADVEVSPDGKDVVTASFLPGAIVDWRRDEGTGQLTPLECQGSTRTFLPTSGNSLPLLDVCAGGIADTGGPAEGLGYPLDVEFSPDGEHLYAAALGLEQSVPVFGDTDQPGSVAVFDRDSATGRLTQPGSPDGCIDDARDPVGGDGADVCEHRTALLNPYRVSVSPDSKNLYVASLNVFPPSSLGFGPGPGELSQFSAADLSQLNPPCLQQLGLPTGGLQPTAGCSLSSFGLILPSDIAFSRDGSSAYVTSLFHSVGSYKRDAAGALTQDAPPGGCLIDPRNLDAGTAILGQICTQTVPLNAPSSIELSPDGKNAYVTSGGFLTGNPSFGPAFADAGVVSDDAITVLGPKAEVPPPPEPEGECQGRPATVVVTGKTVRGTKEDDVIVTGAGKQKIRGGGGNDLICAGPGKDKVTGQGGNDQVLGGPGRDTVKGGGGDDALSGEGGADKLRGGGGNDELIGGPGKDRLTGGPGQDRCPTDKGKDRARGCERGKKGKP